MLSLDFLDDVRRMNKRQLYYQVLNFGMIVSSALMIWKGLMVITGSESPIVVVLSGSMEPAFHRGDLLFLTNRVEDPIRVGEIVVFRIEGREIPIVHRVLKIHEKQNGHIKFLTKGDNNAVDDRGLYKQGQHWLEKKDVVGRARGAGDQTTSPLRCLSSVLTQPERHHLFKCAEIKGALHLCASSSERGADLIFLNRESTLKCCLLASVRSHQGTELYFGGSRSSNNCKGKSCCFLFNKPQSNLIYRGERQRSVCTAEVCVTVIALGAMSFPTFGSQMGKPPFSKPLLGVAQIIRSLRNIRFSTRFLSL
ncbi:signal peptidase complex catalytic subunit SEC11A isoform X1 [Microtus ochrogaster]|uniref:Signal peptidase complex catalytic subunit SEC11 n=1 Tax=Microtus ochrogaster TaxID=79684 RepID=A0ABM1UDS6_MICOH|nr:signal peptidase complex catalytic subunit SEC11A isoform X1 [Microtus ochrogaster]